MEHLKDEVIIMDGAMGSLLMSRGLDLSKTCPDLWNLERPDVIRQVHQEYFEAGAQVLLTNTFGASLNRLKVFRADDKVVEINRKACKLARQVADDRAYVAGNVSTVGTKEIPFKTLAPADAKKIYAQQIQALCDAGVDLLAIETMTDFEEVRCVIPIAQRICSHQVPILLSMTVTPAGILPSGEEPLAVVEFLESQNIPLVGFNCSEGPETILPVAQEVRRHSKLFISVKPNAGLPMNGKYPLSSAEFAKWGKRLVDAGANLIGGCCGTTPEYIRDLAHHIRREKHLSSPSHN